MFPCSFVWRQGSPGKRFVNTSKLGEGLGPPVFLLVPSETGTYSSVYRCLLGFYSVSTESRYLLTVRLLLAPDLFSLVWTSGIFVNRVGPCLPRKMFTADHSTNNN